MKTEDLSVYLEKYTKLFDKGFKQWNKIPEKAKNIISGTAIIIGCLAIPKALFVAAVASVVAGRHMYLSEDSEKTEERDPISEAHDSEDFMHP